MGRIGESTPPVDTLSAIIIVNICDVVHERKYPSLPHDPFLFCGL